MSNVNKERSNMEVQDEQENVIYFLVTAARNSVLGQMLRNLSEEMFPWLYSSELLKNSIHRLCTSLKTEPCTTLFYLLLVIFGFVPFLCFFLFIGAAFIFSVVWFAVCQAVTITVAALLFGGFMIFLIAMCCSIASTFSLIIHILYGWSSLSELFSEFIQCTFNHTLALMERFGLIKQKSSRQNS